MYFGLIFNLLKSKTQDNFYSHKLDKIETKNVV